MNNPVKLLWKAKNNNQRMQYYMYIFVGNIKDNILNILKKITDLNFYDSLIKINKSEYKQLEDYYGEKWYLNFFNTYHVNSFISLILESQTQKNELIDRYGNNWFEKHIKSFKLMKNKIYYSYESVIKNDLLRKMTKKGRSVEIIDDTTLADYTTKKTDILKSKLSRDNQIKSDIESLSGGSEQSTISSVKYRTESLSSGFEQSTISSVKYRTESLSSGFEQSTISSVEYRTESEFSDVSSNSSLSEYKQTGGSNSLTDKYIDHIFNPLFDRKINPNEKLLGKVSSKQLKVYEFKGKITNNKELFGGGDDDDETNEDMDDEDDTDSTKPDEDEPDDIDVDDLNDIEKLYIESDINPDSNLSETSKLIKNILNDEKMYEKMSKLVEFDTSKDTNQYDENIKDCYKKQYILNQYIFWDDTIQTIKEKICCSIKCNPKYGSDAFLIPSRQYLWSEYQFDSNQMKIMLGQKWMRRNELLGIDIEPNSTIRIYEELTGVLKILRDDIRRYNNKIRREDDETNILFDYQDYITNNEIYMVDIYNELGKNYKAEQEQMKNLQDVYLKIYFPKIKNDDLKSIIEFLNSNTKSETNKIIPIFKTLNNDIIIQNEITSTVENVKINDSYKNIFKENYITQSVIHLNLRLIGDTKINLFRVFNEFVVTEEYPFIQYQTSDGTIVYRFLENNIKKYIKKTENKDVLSKWFENAPYGISFKFKLPNTSDNKFMGITLNESGRIEYKTQWKEEDMAKIEDIKYTYDYVKNLIKKLNSESTRTNIAIPDNAEFKYAFINTIQKFELPNNFIINHNDLSNFSRYFFPFVSLVIAPRKRQSKVSKENDKSKFGTYLRYKRVSKYENQARIEQRIMYFIRNYEFTEKALIDEIGKQFNITEEKAIEEYERVKTKYPHLKKSRKMLRRLENIPKYKPPGIGVDIQGKQSDKYKIRISGARDREQLERIIDFMNILIYLYTETYHFKKEERQLLKKRLQDFKNIAERRSKVDDVVNYVKDVKTIKQITQIDKRRLGFKPEKGQNQWSRSCQNSGTDKRRQPQQYNSSNLGDLLKRGYILNKKLGYYEKRTSIKGTGGKKTEIKLRTIGVEELDEEGNVTGNEIHYTCNPEDNGEHFYVGFLTRSTNPFGQCMPCCFKKDPMISKNKEKQEFFKKCLGKGENKITPTDKSQGDKLYILQDTNKIQDGRFGFLPKYLDIYFNIMLNKTKKIKHHYLVKSETGYFFKYGTNQDEFQFLNALSSSLDISLDEIKKKIIDVLEKDKSDQLFTSLNNGDIRTQFGSRKSYIDYISDAENLDFNIINNILSLPNVVSKKGLNIIIFQKNNIVIKKNFEKEQVREDFILLCQNNEDIMNLKDSDRQTVFLIKDDQKYYPIVMIYKNTEETKDIQIVKVFKCDTESDNIINHIDDFYEKNCKNAFTDSVIYKNSSLTSREMRYRLTNLKNKDYSVRYQVIDSRNKTKYIITSNHILIPIRPSGSLYDIQIIKDIEKYIKSFEQTFEDLNNLYQISSQQIPVKPIGVYYDELKDNNIEINSIMTLTHDIVPIIKINLPLTKINQMGLTYMKKPLTDKIDNEIIKGSKNFKIDSRILEINKNKYITESFELFRLEFSEYINKDENNVLKKKIIDTIEHHTLTKLEKYSKIKLLLYRLIDQNLYEKYKSLSSNIKEDDIKDDFKEDDFKEDDFKEDIKEDDFKDDIKVGGKYSKFIQIISKTLDLTNYDINNNREICLIHPDKDKCNLNPHCKWSNDSCYYASTKDMIIIFINKITSQLVQNDLKAYEILRIGNYFVSDIVDFNRFNEREGQKIVRSTSNNIKKVLDDIFGKDYVPVKIGRRKQEKQLETNYMQMNADNYLIDFKDMYIQNIIKNNLQLFRAYVNAYYWLKNKYNNIDDRNLGYYNPMQTELANYFRSLVIDWLNETANRKNITKYIHSKKSSDEAVHEFILKLAKDDVILSDCVVELYVLSIINQIPIVVYNDNKVLYIFDNGLVYKSTSDNNIPEKYKDFSGKNKNDVINLKFSFISSKVYPEEIFTIYFK